MLSMPDIMGSFQQSLPTQSQGGQQPSAPQPMKYNPTPATFDNPIYAKMVGGNGNAPTTDMLNHLNIYGSPAYLMKHHQEQAVNNRREDIGQLYKDVLGREGEQQGMDYWLNSGKSADQLVPDFAMSPEFLSKHQNQNRTFDNQAYLNANPDVAANSYFGQHPEEHYKQHGASEGRQGFYNESSSQLGRDQAIALANQLRSNASQNKQISQNTDYIGQIQGLQKELEALKSQNPYSGDYNSGTYNSSVYIG